MKCASGKHEWIDPDCAAMCCNGYKRIWRAILDPPLPGESEQGQVCAFAMGLVAVWVRDAPVEVPA